MTSPQELLGLMDEWKAERQHHDVVRDTLEEVSRRLDQSNATVALLTEQAAHERAEKERAQRRIALLEAQMSSVAATAHDVGMMLARMIGATAETITRVEPEEPLVEENTAIAGQVDEEPIEVPLFLQRAAISAGLTSSKLPELWL